MDAHLSNIECELTAHGQGMKQVFLRNGDTPTPLTQVAYGEFTQDDVCELHVHPTMEEIFYFMDGDGTYIIDEEEVILKAGVFVRIPAGTPHRIIGGSHRLKYVYFGVAT